MFLIEILIFVAIALVLLLIWFFLNRISTKTNKKIELLETLVEQQDYQITLMRRLLVLSGDTADKSSLTQTSSMPAEHIDTHQHPDTHRHSTLRQTQGREIQDDLFAESNTSANSVKKRNDDDLGVSGIFPER